ncbi:FG-GAP-like repeat-containing protein [Aliikangiella sp. IMCC44359]|uniref:FG-GAP-like repeat-containing protein n=1 Tax=Aliikangiella sp. IMCC44359 TaxID=3459125 RepID=UPI00403AFF63
MGSVIYYLWGLCTVFLLRGGGGQTGGGGDSGGGACAPWLPNCEPESSPPSVPSNVRVPASSSQNFLLEWDASTGFNQVNGQNSGNYQIEQSKNDGSYIAIGTVAASQASSHSYSLSVNDGRYRYRIRACKKDNSNSDYCSNWGSSGEVTVTSVPPSVPANILIQEIGPQNFLLFWDASTGFNQVNGQNSGFYQIERSKNNEAFTLVATVTENQSSRYSYSISEADGRFRVRACQDSGSNLCSDWGTIDGLTVTPYIPDAPNLSGHTVSNEGRVHLTWQQDDKVQYYVLERQVVPGPWEVLEATLYDNFYTVIEREVTQADYAYRLKACGDALCEGYSYSSAYQASINIDWNLVIKDADLISVIAPTNENVGHLNPSVSVNGGAVNASLPIVLPPGRAGMQPSVSISYSSDGGNGLLGKGWSLSAGSSIRRCAHLYDIDQSSRSVMDDDEDKLCLDGTRLMAEANQTYGMSGTVYHPENQPQVTVTQSGSLSGVSSFTVEYANGHQSFYGTNANSRVVRTANGTTITWKLAQKQDHLGLHAIDYEYADGSSSESVGHSLLTSIYYTGSPTTPGNRQVSFEYEARPDVRMTFRNGGSRLMNQRLSHIKTYVGSALVRDYRLVYREEGSQVVARAQDCDLPCDPPSEDPTPTPEPLKERYSILESIQLCVEGGDCLAPTTFEFEPWIEGLDDRVQLISFNQANFIDNASVAGDFDGDGQDDILLGSVDGAYRAKLSGDTSGGYVAIGISPGQKAISGAQGSRLVINAVADFDLDGDVEVLGYAGNNSPKIARWNEATGAFEQVSITDTLNNTVQAGCHGSAYRSDENLHPYFLDCSIYVTDLNGDSKPDLLIPAERTWTGNTPQNTLYDVYINRSTGEDSAGNKVNGDIRFEKQDTSTRISFTSESPVGVIDYDGDGTSDFFFRGHVLNMSENQLYLSTLSNGEWTGVTSVNLPGVALPHRTFTPMDINSDGLTDLISSDSAMTVWLNQGGSLAGFGGGLPSGMVELQDGSDVPRMNYAKYMDYNQDGLTDILLPGQIVENGVCDENTGDGNIRCPAADIKPLINEQAIYSWRIYLAQISDAGGLTFKDMGGLGVYAPLGELNVGDFDGDGYPDIAARLGREIVSTAGTGDYHIYTPSSSPYYATPGLYVHYNPNSQSDRLTGIETGLGVRHEFGYQPLSDFTDNYYHRGTQEVGFPYVNFATNHISVKEYRTSNGLGGMSKTQFQYREATYHKQGRGFQGFYRILEQKFELASDDTQPYYSKLKTDYYQVFPHSGMPLRRTVRFYNDTGVMKTSDIKYSTPIHLAGAYAGTYVAYIKNSNGVNYELDGTVISTQTTDQTLNAYGQLVEKTSTVFDGSDKALADVSKVVKQTFNYNTSQWYQLDSQTTQSTVAYQNDLGFPIGALKDVTVTQTYGYDVNNTDERRPTSVITTTNDSPGYYLQVNTDYGTDGQVETVTTSSNGGTNHDIQGVRSKTVEYTADGYFVAKTFNSLWGDGTPEATHTYDSATGQVLTSSDVNGVKTTNTYDDFARLISTQVEGLPATLSGMQWCNASLCSGINNAVYFVTTRQAGAPESRVYFDKLGREVYKAVDSVNSQVIVAWSEYDNRGRVTKVVEPHYQGAVVGTYGAISYSNFDALSRARTKEVKRDPIEYIVTYSFEGLKQNVEVDVSVGADITMATQNSILGAPLYHQDAQGQLTQFRYDALNNPVVVNDVAGNSITAIYNGFGHKTQMNDPNMGTWSFAYNALGELRLQTDAKSQTTSFDYDALGRIIKSSPQGETASEFFFDPTNHLGMLQKEIKGTAFERHYTYDGYQRPTHVKTLIDGGNKNFIHQTLYDGNYGRVKGEVSPDGLILQHTYNSLGMALQTKDVGTNKIIRLVSDFDARGNIIEQQFGEIINEFNEYTVAGLLKERCATTNASTCLGSGAPAGIQHLWYETYDGYGNLTYLQNLEIGQQEGFVYDNLHRLTQSNRSWDNYTPVTQHETINYGYDGVGNLTYKSDFSVQAANAYQYGDISKSSGNAGPNAVRSITLKPVDNNSSSTILNYDYDNNGNLIDDGIRTISYGVNNKPVTISTNSASLGFSYGSDGQRYKQVKTKNSVTTTTYYAGNYELEEKSGNSTSRTSVGGYALYRTENGTSSWHYLLRDHLGSMDTIVDASGTVEQRRNFDPFGKARDAMADDTKHGDTLNSALELGGQLDSDITPRGFTDHEHLDDVELIHMNGRVYDYHVGRFLSVDPFISMPGSSQAYNPYSYVMNNPLSYTDPTGYTNKKVEADNAEKCDKECRERRARRKPTKCITSYCIVAKDPDGNTIYIPVTVGNGAGNSSENKPKPAEGSSSQERVRFPKDMECRSCTLTDQLLESEMNEDISTQDRQNTQNAVGVAGATSLAGEGVGYVVFKFLTWGGSKLIAIRIASKGSDDVAKTVLSKGERLKIFSKNLADAPAATNADDALRLINKIMDEVEDAYSGVAAKVNPGLKYEGRMYGPRKDFVTELPNGGLEAITAGNIIRISPNGGIQFFIKNKDKSAGKMIFNKAGGG